MKFKIGKHATLYMNQTNRLMATVYMKDGNDVQVPIEELTDYLHNNVDKIETRHREVKRKMFADISTDAESN